MKHRARCWARCVCALILISVVDSGEAAQLLHMDAPNRIPGVFKVMFKDKGALSRLTPNEQRRTSVAPTRAPISPADTQFLASELARAANVQMTHVFQEDGSKGFAVRGLTSALMPKALLADPRVAYIEPAMWLTTHGALQLAAPWHLDRIDQRNLPLDGSYAYATTAPDVDVYVFDTGITAWHSEFTLPCRGGVCSRLINETDEIPGNIGAGVPYVNCMVTYQGLHQCSGTYGIRLGFNGYPLGAPDSGDPCFTGQTPGHGTMMAALIGGKTFGVAKAVKLHSFTISDCAHGNTMSDVDLISAIQYALFNLPQQYPSGSPAYPTIFNLSLGSTSHDTALDNQVKAAINKGVVVVVSAGNDNRDACTVSPADVSTAIVVGASQIDDQAWWSNTFQGTNFGPCVSLFAPGAAIVTATNTSLTATTANAPVTGTSASAAMVSGLAALYLESHAGASPAEVKAALIQSATTGKLRGQGFGTGSPNLLASSLAPTGNQPPQAPGQTMSGVRAAIISAIYALFN